MQRERSRADRALDWTCDTCGDGFGETKVLDAVVAAYPEPISRQDLGEQVGYKPTARDTYISRLASRRLVQSDGRGTVRASAELFS